MLKGQIKWYQQVEQLGGQLALTVKKTAQAEAKVLQCKKYAEELLLCGANKQTDVQQKPLQCAHCSAN